MVSNGGTKGIMLKKTMYSFGNFSAFFLWSPIGNHEKKSCLNKLKFWEASRNHKKSLSWKFQYSILKNAETSHIPESVSENPVPLYSEIIWPLHVPGKNHDVQAAAPPINTNWCPYDWEASDEVKMILEHNTLLTISSSCYWKSIIRLMGDGDKIVHRFLGICFSVYW